MSTPTPVPTPNQLLQQLLSSVFSTFEADELQTVLPALATFFNAWAANPTVLELTAAVSQLEVDVLAAQPGIGQALLKLIASTVSQIASQAATAAKATAK